MQIEPAMFKAGRMARAGGRLIKICSIDKDLAQCMWFDNRGRVHSREYDVDALTSFEMSARPRSLWPEINQMPDHIVAQLDAEADAKRRARFTKPKRSHKSKRD